MLKLIKSVVLNTLYYSGVFKLIFLCNRNSVTFFMLHGVTDDQYQGDWKPLWKRAHTDEIRTALQVLAPYVDFIDADQAHQRLTGNSTSSSRPGIVFTFDDGYENNLVYAYPVFNAAKAPIMIYFATSFVEKQKLYWIDEIDYLLQAQQSSIIELKVEEQEFSIDASTRKTLTRDYQKLRLNLRELYPDEREMLDRLNDVKAQLDPEGKILSGDALDNLMLSIIDESTFINGIPRGVDVGSHSVNHLRLGNLDKSTIDTEVREAKAYIEEKRGEACRHFCYPVGSFSADAAESVADAGYMTAVTTGPGINRPGDNLFTLQRLAFPDVSSKPQVLFFMCRALLKDQWQRFRSANRSNRSPAATLDKRY